MARTARVRSASGIYHITVRGVNKQVIFKDDQDARVYLSLLRRLKLEVGCVLYGYCLMNNHVHLLVKENTDGIVSKLMHRLGTAFAIWHNAKYERVGHLFQGRFASEAVEDEKYFLTVLRYIHQNPVRAGLISECARHPFTSYHAYSLGFDPFGIADTAFALELFGTAKSLLEFFNTPTDDTLNSQANTSGKEKELRQELATLLAKGPATSLEVMSKKQRDLILRTLKATGKYSSSQIAQVTGVSKATVVRA